MENLVPRTGVGVIVLKDGKMLLGKRKNAHGEGEYCFPGGHLEQMEGFEDCARREVREEAGLEVGPMRFIALFNCKEFAPKHYVGLGFVCDWVSGEPTVREPEKCEGWDWYAPDALPSPLFAPARYTFEAWKTGRPYFDT